MKKTLVRCPHCRAERSARKPAYCECTGSKVRMEPVSMQWARDRVLGAHTRPRV